MTAVSPIYTNRETSVRRSDHEDQKARSKRKTSCKCARTRLTMSRQERHPTRRCQKCLMQERVIRLHQICRPVDQCTHIGVEACPLTTRHKARSKRNDVRNAECTHEATISVRETRRQRDTRIDDHPAMPDDPTDHAVAQTTQWSWRPLANCSGKVSHRPDREAGDDPRYAIVVTRVREPRRQTSHLMRVRYSP